MSSTDFIGREGELADLNAAYRASNSAFWPIYGRRRVGKSELILRFSQPLPSIYLLGKRHAPPEQMMRELLEVAAIALDEPLLATMPVETWKKTLKAVVDRWKPSRKLVLTLDEFQWIAEKSPEIVSVLQDLWDGDWKKNGRLFLILCGSYIGFMEREVLGKKSPLFGRRTGQILLKPFSYLHAAQFHRHASLQQKAMTYFICGGIPLYLSYFTDDRSLLQNIEHVILNERAPLHYEPDFLLREELREVENYYAILMALSQGAAPSREIARRSGVNDRSLHYYLDQLLKLGYVGKHYPLTESPPKARDVRYRLLDPFLRFWFHFIYPHTSLIAQVGSQRAATQIIQPSLDAYFGGCFEMLCREALPRIYDREGVSATYEIGSYWGPQVQIDLVGLRKDGWTDIGECKWGTASLPTVAAELDRKIVHYPNTRGASIGRRIFLQSHKPTRARLEGNLRVHTLKDLYG